MRWKNARDTIQRVCLSYIIRKRWRKNVLAYATRFMAVVVKLQRAFRFKKRQEMMLRFFRRRKAATIKI